MAVFWVQAIYVYLESESLFRTLCEEVNVSYSKKCKKSVCSEDAVGQAARQFCRSPRSHEFAVMVTYQFLSLQAIIF